VIDLVGISGGLNIAVQGQMTTSYTTTAIALGDGTIEDAAGQVTVEASASGFGGALAVPVSATGVVHYEPSVIFDVRFDIALLGIQVVNITLASVELPLPEIDRTVTLASQPLSIPLPRLDPIPTSLGFANGATQTLAIHDAGEAPLAIAIPQLPAGVTASVTTATIAAGADGTIAITAADPTALAGATIDVETNDPSHPTLSIALDPAQAGETTMPPPGEGSGCAAGRGDPGLLLALVLAIAAAPRQRRNVRTSWPGRQTHS
jgi:hypothetical protein